MIFAAYLELEFAIITGTEGTLLGTDGKEVLSGSNDGNELGKSITVVKDYIALGLPEGNTEGSTAGTDDGLVLGLLLGTSEGREDGDILGRDAGMLDRDALGFTDGVVLGTTEGVKITVGCDVLQSSHFQTPTNPLLVLVSESANGAPPKIIFPSSDVKIAAPYGFSSIEFSRPFDPFKLLPI